MSLYSVTKGKDVDDIIFIIVDQLQYDVLNLAVETPELRTDIAKLYSKAVLKAMASSDYAMAYSYSTSALSLLPCWESHYELKHWFVIQIAKSSYSLADYDKAQFILLEVLENGRSFDDKVHAYYILARSKLIFMS